MSNWFVKTPTGAIFGPFETEQGAETLARDLSANSDYTANGMVVCEGRPKSEPELRRNFRGELE